MKTTKKLGALDVRSVFMIMNAAGEFSSGGSSPRFSATGKMWTSRGAVHNHINLAGEEQPSRWGGTRGYGPDAVVVEIELTPRVCGTNNVNAIRAELKAKAKIREDKAKAKRAERERAYRAQQLSQVLKNYSPEEIQNALETK